MSSETLYPAKEPRKLGVIDNRFEIESETNKERTLLKFTSHT